MMYKTLQLLSLLPRHPREFYERVSSRVSSRLESGRNQRANYRATPLEQGIALLEQSLNADLKQYLQEPALNNLRAHIQQRAAHLDDAPFASHHNGGSCIAQLCYALARALRPSIAVETGVCYGITSAHLLCALEQNREGSLHSIDLPPLAKNGDAYVGSLIPQELRARWTLHRGPSRRLLPRVCATLGLVDLFLHDSLHTYENMRAEFATAWTVLGSRSVLIADDVQGNAAFEQLARLPDVLVAMVFEEPSKGALFGVAVKR
jgi:Methyltransferase domain